MEDFIFFANTKNNALSRIMHIRPNSFAKFNGNTYIGTDDGLKVYGNSNTDYDLSNIVSEIEIVPLKFGSNREKRFRYLFFTGIINGSISISIHDEEKELFSSVVTGTSSIDPITKRISLPRTAQCRRLIAKIKNIDSSYFKTDSVSVVFMERPGGTSRSL